MRAARRTRSSRYGRLVSVIANAVIPRDNLEADADSCVIHGERPVLGVVGRLSHEKGVDVFLRAASLLAREGAGFSAVVVGDGPDRSSLEALARELGLAERVRFTGSLKNMRAVYEAIEQETRRQHSQIELIASENFTSEAILEAAGSVFTNKYAEGYPGKRYYAGCEFADVVENLARERALKAACRRDRAGHGGRTSGWPGIGAQLVSFNFLKSIDIRVRLFVHDRRFIACTGRS